MRKHAASRPASSSDPNASQRSSLAARDECGAAPTRVDSTVDRGGFPSLRKEAEPSGCNYRLIGSGAAECYCCLSIQADMRTLWVEAARQRRLGHPADGQHVRRQAQVDVVLDSGALDVVER